MSGDCFEVSSKLMFSSKNYKLIHAIVERRSDRKKHIHSFIINTKTNMIIEKSNGLDIQLPIYDARSVSSSGLLWDCDTGHAHQMPGRV